MNSSLIRSIAGITMGKLGVAREKKVVASFKICCEDVHASGTVCGGERRVRGESWDRRNQMSGQGVVSKRECRGV